jgi:hypothetical protein
MNKDMKMVYKTYFPFQECFVSSFRLCCCNIDLMCHFFLSTSGYFAIDLRILNLPWRHPSQYYSNWKGLNFKVLTKLNCEKNIFILNSFPKTKIIVNSITFDPLIQKLWNDKHAHCFVEGFGDTKSAMWGPMMGAWWGAWGGVGG